MEAGKVEKLIEDIKTLKVEDIPKLYECAVGGDRESIEKFVVYSIYKKMSNDKTEEEIKSILELVRIEIDVVGKKV
jgi:predicted phosphohydrolase